MEKVIIAGSRGCEEWNEDYFKKIDSILVNLENVVIISGTARGADKLGENYSKRRHLKLIKMPADWNKYGNSAGMVRNNDMADYGDYLIAFWDGKSKGTSHMIKTAKEKGLKVRIISI